MVNRAARWILARERYHHRREAADDDQLAIYKGEPIGHIRMETGGPRRGEWVSSMFRDAPDVNMRIETSGIVEPEGGKDSAWWRATRSCSGEPAGLPCGVRMELVEHDREPSASSNCVTRRC